MNCNPLTIYTVNLSACWSSLIISSGWPNMGLTIVETIIFLDSIPTIWSLFSLTFYDLRIIMFIASVPHEILKIIVMKKLALIVLVTYNWILCHFYACCSCRPRYTGRALGGLSRDTIVLIMFNEGSTVWKRPIVVVEVVITVIFSFIFTVIILHSVKSIIVRWHVLRYWNWRTWLVMDVGLRKFSSPSSFVVHVLSQALLVIFILSYHLIFFWRFLFYVIFSVQILFVLDGCLLYCYIIPILWTYKFDLIFLREKVVGCVKLHIFVFLFLLKIDSLIIDRLQMTITFNLATVGIW